MSINKEETVSKWSYIQVPRTDEEMEVYREACQLKAEELGLQRLPMKAYVKALIDQDVSRLRKKYKTKQ